MIALLLAGIPLLGAAVSFLFRREKTALWSAVIIAFVEFVLAVILISDVQEEVIPFFGNYLVCDGSAKLFLLLISSVFLGFLFYVFNRVKTHQLLLDRIVRFVCLCLVFLSSAVISILSGHFILTWIALEVTTLAATPLIYHQKERVGYRASWRYLLFSSVSLGLTLLGFLIIAHGFDGPVESRESVLFFRSWLESPLSIAPPWKALGVFLVVFGFCSKLGLAPWYTWLPETYDAAPPSVTTLLAAVQFNCALFALLRALQAFRALVPDMVRYELLALGFASIAVAAINIVVEKNYKKLIAYASINHAGVIAIGLGLGKSASYGVILYVLSNALVKAILFMTCGSIKSRFQTKNINEVHGLIQQMPYSGWFFMIGVFALLGFAPFGSFFGEVIIMTSMIEHKYYGLFAVFCLLLTVIFVAMGRSVFPMIWGQPNKEIVVRGESLYTLLPNLFFIFLLVAMGIYVPASATSILRSIASGMGGQ